MQFDEAINLINFVLISSTSNAPHNLEKYLPLKITLPSFKRNENHFKLHCKTIPYHYLSIRRAIQFRASKYFDEFE